MLNITTVNSTSRLLYVRNLIKQLWMNLLRSAPQFAHLVFHLYGLYIRFVTKFQFQLRKKIMYVIPAYCIQTAPSSWIRVRGATRWRTIQERIPAATWYYILRRLALFFPAPIFLCGKEKYANKPILQIFMLQNIHKKKIVRCGVRTHAPSREPELKSGALDRSANLTSL